MLERKNAAAPLAAWLAGAIACALAMTALLPGWTWSLFDELAWVDIHARLPGVGDFVREDWLTNGRFRPLSPLPVYLKFQVLGLDPRWLRVERILELALASWLALFLLARRQGVPLAAALVGIGFWIKSPPQLEQLRWMTVSEMHGIVFLLAALVLRPGGAPAGTAEPSSAPGQPSRAMRLALSYAFLILCALTKEPFAALLPLPALLDHRKKEAAAAAVAGAAFLGVLYLNRHGYSAAAGEGLTTGALREIFRQGAVDFAWALPALALPLRSRPGEIARGPLRSAAVFAVFSAVYGGLIASRAWAYTYYFAPAILLAGRALGNFLAACWQAVTRSRFLAAYMTFLCLLFPARLLWNWTRVYLATHGRHELILEIERLSSSFHPSTPPRVGTNCAIDRKGFGLAADLRLGKKPRDARPEGGLCHEPPSGIAACCRGSELAAIGRECAFFDERIEEARRLGMAPVWRNKSWHLFACPK